MTQTRRDSLLEAATRSAIGVPTGFTVTLFVGLADLNPFAQAFVITCTMFVAQTITGYLLRRRFERFARSLQTIDYERRRIKEIIE